jgi:hypothetical protein
MNASFVLGIDPGKSFFAATLMQTNGERVWKARQFDMSRDGFDELISSLPEGDLTVGIEASGRIDDNLLAWTAAGSALSRSQNKCNSCQRAKAHDLAVPSLAGPDRWVRLGSHWRVYEGIC